MHQCQLINLVPFADGHGLYLFLLAELTAADESEEIALDNIHLIRYL